MAMTDQPNSKEQARAHYEQAMGFVNTFEDNLKKILKKKKDGGILDDADKQIKKTLDEVYATHVVPLLDISKNAVIRGHGDKELEKWHKKVDEAYQKLYSKVAEIFST